MVDQITPVGTAPLLSATVSAKPAPMRSAPSRAPGGQAGRVVIKEETVAQVNQHLQEAQTDLKLQVDGASGRTVFQVVQQGTGEVVLQIPSEEILAMSRRMRELGGQPGSSGALVDKKG